MVGSRSAFDWLLDRYQVKADKASGIKYDPNDWSREVGNPCYIIDLVARITTVSVETMRVVNALPPLAIRDAQTDKTRGRRERILQPHPGCSTRSPGASKSSSGMWRPFGPHASNSARASAVADTFSSNSPRACSVSSQTRSAA